MESPRRGLGRRVRRAAIATGGVTMPTMSLARGAASTEDTNGDHVATPRMGDIHLPRPTRPPLWRRITTRFFSSVLLHFLALVAILYAYNRAVYVYGWVTSRPPPYFSDVAAPLYAQLEDWVYRDLMPPESANWAQFWFDVRSRLH